MIQNQTEYNPLPEIMRLVPKAKVYTVTDIDLIRKELFKGGIAPETEDEVSTVLTLLHEMDII